MSTGRPSWEEYALLLAETAKLRSEDIYLKVGACALRFDHSVAALGYNGAPPGIEIDWSDRDKRRVKVSHAESNCLRYCKPGEIWLLASTLQPCCDCLKQIAMYGIKLVVYKEEYKRDEFSLDLAKEFGINLVKIS